MEAQEKYENLPVEAPAPTMDMATSLFFNAAKFELAQRVAKVFAASDMVPKQFQGNIGNCVIALNLADRMGTDPFMLMQNIYIVHGKPGIEAKLAIALVNNTGKFSPLQYEYDTDKTECHAWAILKKTGEVCNGPAVSLEMAKAEGWMSKPGSKWKTMPSLMLMYRAAMFFARVYCPEALLGMQTREELYDTVDMVSAGNGSYEPEESTDDLAARITENNRRWDNRIEEKIIDENKEWWHPDNWLNLRSGYVAWIGMESERLDTIPDEAVCTYERKEMRVIDAMRQKWYKLNPDEPFPGDEPENPPDEPPEAQDETQTESEGNGSLEKLRGDTRALRQMFRAEYDAALSELGLSDAPMTMSREALHRLGAKVNEILDRNAAGK